MSKVLITGANGFIGRAIALKLKGEHEVVGCGRTLPKNDSIRFVQWNIESAGAPSELRDIKFDCIVHAAACLSMDNLSDDLIHTNCTGTFNILKYAINCPVESIIYISSLPIVGNLHELPITENALVCPETLYHSTKAAGEQILMQGRHYGIRAVSLRVPSPVGPDMPENTIVPVFIKKALAGEDITVQGKGSRKQNYLDVRDLAGAVERILEKDGVSGIYNIGAKNVVSNFHLANMCVSILNSSSKIVRLGRDAYDDIDWTTDDSKLRDQIGDYQGIDMRQSIIDIAKGMDI